MWHLTRDTLHVTSDTLHLTPDMWHMIQDMWHMTCDTWWGMNILSKCQLPSSFGLGSRVSWSFWMKGSPTQWMNEWINDKGVYRTSPATPSLLNIGTTLHVRLLVANFADERGQTDIQKIFWLTDRQTGRETYRQTDRQNWFVPPLLGKSCCSWTTIV